MYIPKYYIGIDFGYDETYVSRVSGTHISRVPLLAGDSLIPWILSAIYRDDNGNWQLVRSKNDLINPDVMKGFNGIIETLTYAQREALREFARLVFKTILENDNELMYNQETGEANFVICIATPFSWCNQHSMNPKEYLSFFQNEAGIKPAEMCIYEFDAAYYSISQQHIEPEDKVLIIGLSSKTIDFRTFYKHSVIHDCSWGDYLRSNIEEKIIKYGYMEAEEREENVRNMEIVKKARNSQGLGTRSVEEALYFAVRSEMDLIFSGLHTELEIMVRFRDLVPGWVPRSAIAFSLFLDSHEVEYIIKDYISDLSIALSNARKKIRDFGISPNKIILLGNSNRMPFVRQLVEKEFPESKLFLTLEDVVSDGAALCAESFYRSHNVYTNIQGVFLHSS